MRYVRKTITGHQEYELTANAVKFAGRVLGSGDWQVSYPLDELSPDITKASGRQNNATYVAVVLLVVLFVLLIYVFGSATSNTHFFVRNQSLIVAAAVVGIYALGVVRPTIHFTNFRFSSGVDAFSVILDRRRKAEYEAFISAVTEAVARAHRGTGAA